MAIQQIFTRKARSSSTFTLVALCFALFTDTFVYGIIVPILPFLLMGHSNMASKDGNFNLCFHNLGTPV
ncbi:unnamed protein product [Penicillium crustosum]